MLAGRRGDAIQSHPGFYGLETWYEEISRASLVLNRTCLYEKLARDRSLIQKDRRADFFFFFLSIDGFYDRKQVVAVALALGFVYVLCSSS